MKHSEIRYSTKEEALYQRVLISQKTYAIFPEIQFNHRQ